MRAVVLVMLLAGGLAFSAPASPPNVVLLSVDTLRADRLGVYGYPYDTTPNLDAFAEDALLFEDAVCEIPLTGPIMGSMLSSRYPRMNGMTRNGLRMPDNVPLVAELFQEAGYRTWCVQSNWTLKAHLSGMDRGFDHYDDDFGRRRWGIVSPERRGEEVTRLALERLAEQEPDQPFFAWIHYSDPHAPYRMRRGHNPQGRRAWRLPREERVAVRYDSEVAFTDAQIGKILEALPENTAVLFVADHGESLYEHNYIGHGRRIYQPGMHIPLMIQGPGVAPGRTDVPVTGIDIGPTLLALADIEPMPTMLGYNLLAETPPRDRVRFLETYGGAVPRLPGVKGMLAQAAPMRQGLIQEGWKLITGGNRAELYNLAEDPGELRNLATQEPEKLEALRAKLDAWDTETVHAEAEGDVLSEDDRAALESLGYLE